MIFRGCKVEAAGPGVADIDTVAEIMILMDQALWDMYRSTDAEIRTQGDYWAMHCEIRIQWLR